MTPERSAAQAAQQIADALEKAGLPHAIGGALALAIAGVPRGTADVDINVFVELDRIGEVIDVLASLDIDVDRTRRRGAREARRGCSSRAGTGCASTCGGSSR